MRNTSQCVRKWRSKPLAEVLLLFSCDCKRVTSQTSAQFLEKWVRIPKRQKNSRGREEGKARRGDKGKEKRTGREEDGEGGRGKEKHGEKADRENGQQEMLA